ncbi:alpha-1 2-mannosidase [Silvibacterium dinghuense]|nr:alpha-1 2-mannosidase [Silvibacterium dinghuense]
MLLWVLSGTCAALAQSHPGNGDPYSLVDPHIGTSYDGQTYPVVGMPFGMTGWTPETQATENKCLSPYYYKDSHITGFRGSHWLSGSCTQDYGSVTLMPVVGDLKVAPSARASRFSHDSEVMSPAYYSVLLEDYQTKVELTGTTRAGMLRITYPAAGVRHLVVQPNVRAGQGFVEVRPDRHEIVGYNPVVRIYQGAGKSAGFSGYFALRYQEKAADFGTWCGKDVSQHALKTKIPCTQPGAFVTFAGNASSPVLVKIGTSFTSVEEAEKNLDAEEQGWNFDEVQQETEKAWKHLLGRIEIEGGTPEERTVFYTALFHASLAPRMVSDVDGSYRGFAQEGKLHRTAGGSAYYDDFSLWDTFRALHPLLTILEPQRDQQMVQSLIDKGEQGGFLPIFPTWNSYTSEMIGDHAAPVIVDAYAKGLRDFDVAAAYRLIRQNAFVTPPRVQYVDGKGRRALTSYMRYGFVPLEDEVLDAFHHREQVSRTLEYAYDDSVVAQFAEALGHTEDADVLRKRSANWRRVFDPSTGFVRGRYANGNWITPFDPSKPVPYITEGLPWQYTFFVPQDISGLIQASGGAATFIEKLDGLFDKGLYDQGNEPSHGIAYLYNYAGTPWKTQERVRQIMLANFHGGPDGLPGNDDAGQMSAWYVLSAMGFYPECPGTPMYSIGSPLFTRIVIHQDNGKNFTILAPGSSARSLYVRSVQRDGVQLLTYEFRHEDIVNGSTLTFEMSAEPNKTTMGPVHGK